MRNDMDFIELLNGAIGYIKNANGDLDEAIGQAEVDGTWSDDAMAICTVLEAVDKATTKNDVVEEFKASIDTKGTLFDENFELDIPKFLKDQM